MRNSNLRKMNGVLKAIRVGIRVTNENSKRCNLGDKKRGLNKLGKGNAKTNEYKNTACKIPRVIKCAQVQSGRDKF